jgi:hypothetical protein
MFSRLTIARAGVALVSQFAGCTASTGEGHGSSAMTTEGSATADHGVSTEGTSAAATSAATTSAPATTDASGETGDSGSETGAAEVCPPLPTCSDAVDCCGGVAVCEASIGTYPFNYECVDGVCHYPGCANDDQCNDNLGPGWICAQHDGYGGCELPCVTDATCEDSFLTDFVCLDNGAGRLTCQIPPCANDSDCFPGAACDVPSGYCVPARCTSDSDCGDFDCAYSIGFCDWCTYDAPEPEPDPDDPPNRGCDPHECNDEQINCDFGDCIVCIYSCQGDECVQECDF